MDSGQNCNLRRRIKVFALFHVVLSFLIMVGCLYSGLYISVIYHFDGPDTVRADIAILVILAVLTGLDIPLAIFIHSAVRKSSFQHYYAWRYASLIQLLLQVTMMGCSFLVTNIVFWMLLLSGLIGVVFRIVFTYFVCKLCKQLRKNSDVAYYTL